MRYLNAAFFVVLLAAAVSSLSNAQTNERPPSEGQFEPFHKHHDTHFGHDHFYPDRGSMIREVPKEAAAVSYAGLSYKFYDGVWYEPRGPAFMVVGRGDVESRTAFFGREPRRHRQRCIARRYNGRALHGVVQHV